MKVKDQPDQETKEKLTRQERDKSADTFTEEELRELMGVDRQIYYRKRGAIRSKKN